MLLAIECVAILNPDILMTMQDFCASNRSYTCIILRVTWLAKLNRFFKKIECSDLMDLSSISEITLIYVYHL